MSDPKRLTMLKRLTASLPMDLCMPMVRICCLI